MVKNYILDTNILIQSPNSIYGFGDNNVIITGTTLEELDKKKTAPGETGYHAREVIRKIEELRTKGVLAEGVELPENGKLIIVANAVRDNLPPGYSLSVPDNQIISAAITIAQKDPNTFLITNDISMRIKADVCGVKVQEYRNETVETGEKYTGRSTHIVPESIISKARAGEEIPVSILGAEKPLVENEYVMLQSEENVKNTVLCYYRNGMVRLMKEAEGYNGITGKNAAQKCLMHALMLPAEEVPLVVVTGPAGTGKTMLALACGLSNTYTSFESKKHAPKEYNSIMITRTNTLSDEDLGFLPGTLEEKMGPLVSPFMDNLEFIFSGKERDADLAAEHIGYILDRDILKIESVAYMRGRSLSHTYLIVDEAQNMTINQVLEIVSRAGEGTKIVLLGDPDQIDNPKLDRKNNGLVFAAERMKGSSLCAQVAFEQKETVRSPLAAEAAKRLTV